MPSDVTEMVREIVGNYPYPGKHEAGTNLDVLVSEWPMNGDTGEDSCADDAYGWAGLYTEVKTVDFRNCGGADSTIAKDILDSLTMVRALVAWEDDRGFFHVRYFDDANLANDFYCELTVDWNC